MNSLYSIFKYKNNYTTDLQHCIEKTVDCLIDVNTSSNNPGLLLGKIQSGKTRAFLGIIALSFDRGYDVCVIFTKGTKALSEQTLKRIRSEFSELINSDIVKVYDIMSMSDLSNYVLGKKIIIIAKKEIRNLNKLDDLFEKYNIYSNKEILFIDDEADLASVGFKNDKKQKNNIDINAIPRKLDNIRNKCHRGSFLQVTATPYSLYLQPSGEYNLNNEVFRPIRPTFTTLVPIHDAYVGGVQYFEESQNQDSHYSRLYIQVPDNEISVLDRPDRRYLNNILTTDNLSVFRKSIINYFVAGSIRILQNRMNQMSYKSSFIVHTSVGKSRHEWQIKLVNTFVNNLVTLIANDDDYINSMFKESYRDLEESIRLSDSRPHIPDMDSVYAEFKYNMKEKYFGIIKINSENDIMSLLDDNGQLRLDNPFNIFVGGQILDRGLTIDNLIGFFYGRNPKTFQQDTVLQHSRMYGARSEKDMAVTRLYTSRRIYEAMQKMHSFDSALRDAFESGIHNGDDGVVFVERDDKGTIRPCSPSKILITQTNTIKPHSRFLPIGFQTKSKSNIQATIDAIDNILQRESLGVYDEPFLIDVKIVNDIIHKISSTYEYSTTYGNIDMKWDHTAFMDIIYRLQNEVKEDHHLGKIYCYVQTGRNLSRMKNFGTTYSDAPDDGNTDRRIAKGVATDTACLILLKQNGHKDKGWRDAEFWWPILVTSRNCRTAIFSTGKTNLGA